MLLQFNRFAVMTGIASLIIVAVYPFMKRITWWPQVVLGLAFSWGALMGFAVDARPDRSDRAVLYAGSIAWVIGYDTIYAHQDAEDDALIGIKSTARLFGARTHRALAVFYARGGFDRRGAGAGGARWPAWIGLVAFAAHWSGKSGGSTSAIPRCACEFSNPTAMRACCCLRDARGCGDAFDFVGTAASLPTIKRTARNGGQAALCRPFS